MRAARAFSELEDHRPPIAFAGGTAISLRTFLTPRTARLDPAARGRSWDAARGLPVSETPDRALPAGVSCICLSGTRHKRCAFIAARLETLPPDSTPEHTKHKLTHHRQQLLRQASVAERRDRAPA
jgi:hypothetical protein